MKYTFESKEIKKCMDCPFMHHSTATAIFKCALNKKHIDIFGKSKTCELVEHDGISKAELTKWLTAYCSVIDSVDYQNGNVIKTVYTDILNKIKNGDFDK